MTDDKLNRHENDEKDQPDGAYDGRCRFPAPDARMQPEENG